MIRAHVQPLAVALLLSVLVTGAPARKAPPLKLAEPADRVLPTGAPPSRIATTFTSILGSWNFEDGMDGSDPQGWTPYDLTAELDTFFHVDDLAGLNGWDPPFEGARSLWCGARPCEIPEVCSYATLPGYGNGWDQRFESTAFAVTGNVNMVYLIRWDTEPSYDFVYVQYQSRTGRWNTLRTYSGDGAWSHSVTAPADSLAGSVRFRFLFQSDDFASDEDGNFDTNGAVILDMIEVSDAGGSIDYQDFESEAVGAQATVDGHWFATTSPSFSNYAALFDGSTVLQEDSLVTNDTWFWGFFNGSTETYECGGHPEQAAVPYSKMIDGTDLYLYNEVRSPAIPVDLDMMSAVLLTFDVYRDLPLDNLVFYRWRIRSRVGGIWRDWKDRDYLYWSPSPSWYIHSDYIQDLIDPNATDVQIGISAYDACRHWCGVYGTGACHSHAPLIDNVRLVSFLEPTITVTSAAESGPGTLAEAITAANANPDRDVIGFDIPGAGPHTITPVSVLPTIVQPVVIDGYTQPGSSENTSAPWESGNAVLKIMLDGSALAGQYDDGLAVYASGCTIRGLAIGNFPSDGIFLRGNENVVEGCYIGTDASGTTAAPNGNGVSIPWQCVGNVVGAAAVQVGESLQAPCRNVISGNTYNGVMITATSGNRVEGNFIGTDASGTSGLGNQTYGVRLYDASDCDLWSCVISANALGGIAMFGSGTGNNRVQSNRIGTDVTGTAQLANTGDGVYIADIGGTGIVIGGSPSYANLIAYNSGDGIDMRVPPTGSHTVAHNTIHSNGRGMVVSEVAGSGVVSIVYNSIASNSGLGIDLGGDGVTANDAQDVDIGPNGLLNYPVLTSAIAGVGDVTIVGSLHSTPNETFWVQFFSSSACDPSGHGEGEVFQGSITITTDGSGDAVFSTVLPVVVPPGYHMTATAGSVSSGATSEFSACVEVINTPSGSGVQVELQDDGAEATLTFENITSPGITSLNTTSSCAELPGTFFAPDSLCYDITTTATFSGDVEVCFTYDEGSLAGSEADVRLIHYDATAMPPAWVDITTSVDTDANRVCGETGTLSPFVIGIGSATAVGPDPLPSHFALHPNVPNPFNPTTVIRYDVAVDGTPVTIRVYDVAGRLVRTLLDERRPAGVHQVTWDARSGRGEPVATGVYFYRMQAGSFVQTRKMVLLK